MYAQIAYFDGPRSPELVAASDRAGTERIEPAVLADEQCRAAHVATFVLRADDGAEIVLVVAQDEAALDRAGRIIMSTELLPGEDPALLPGPDRVTRYAVVHASERGRAVALEIA